MEIGAGSFANVYMAAKVNSNANGSEEEELVAVKQIKSMKRLFIAKAEVKWLRQFKGLSCITDLLGVYSDTSSF